MIGFYIWDLVACVGGVFKLELFLPEEYPMAAPKVSQHQSPVNTMPGYGVF